MIAAEMKNDVSTVRFHDEYYVNKPNRYMAQLGQIVTDSYRRRTSQKACAVCRPDDIVDRRS